MKIVHVCMVDAFSDGWSYHRNIISEKNKEDGHDVTIITTKYRMGNSGESVLDKSGIFYTKKGIKVIRLEDIIPGLPKYIQDRLHWTKVLYRTLLNEKPDIIMVHNLQFVNLFEITKYKKNHPSVRLVGDTHADRFVAIGKNVKKSEIVHKTIWRRIIKKNFKYFDKFYYTGYIQKEFFEEMYSIDLSDAELSPLPAEIIDRPLKLKIRENIRRELQIGENTLLFIHSGRINKRKKTVEMLLALRKVNIDCRLLIFGNLSDDVKSEVMGLINNDKRVSFVGWTDNQHLREYIAAADLYLQPGTMSVTMQNALSVGTPIMVYPHRNLEIYLKGCEFRVKNQDEIQDIFLRLSTEKDILNDMSEDAYKVAKKYFDIDIAANRLYSVEVK